MLDANYKEKGFGSRIYCQLENLFRSEGSTKVRIDVVYDYQDNSLGFWKNRDLSHTKKYFWNGMALNLMQ